MPVIESRATAPPIVRRIGYFFLALTALSVYVLIMASLQGRVRWYQLIGLPVTLAIGIGLVRERRWAYVGALAVAGIQLLLALVILVIVVVQPSHMGWVIAMIFTLMNMALAAPPLLLLGEPGRAWFQDRELEPA